MMLADDALASKHFVVGLGIALLTRIPPLPSFHIHHTGTTSLSPEAAPAQSHRHHAGVKGMPDEAIDAGGDQSAVRFRHGHWRAVAAQLVNASQTGPRGVEKSETAQAYTQRHGPMPRPAWRGDGPRSEEYRLNTDKRDACNTRFSGYSWEVHDMDVLCIMGQSAGNECWGDLAR